MLAAVARTLGLDTVNLTDAKPDLKLLETFPIRLIHRFHIFPCGCSVVRWCWRSAIRSICTRWMR